MCFNLKKFINCRTLDRISVTFLILLLSLLLLSATRFLIQAFYPAPYWQDFCLASCNNRDELLSRQARMVYQHQLQIIFYVMVVISLIGSIIIKKSKVAQYALIAFGFATMAFAFFSAPEQNWYIEFGLPPSIIRSLVMSSIFLAVAYLLFIRIDEVHTKMLHDQNFTCKLFFKKSYKESLSKVGKKILKKVKK